MANTLTIEEFNRIQEKTNLLTLKRVIQYNKAMDIGAHNENLKARIARQSFLYAKAIEGWEQDKFNSINFTNPMSSNNIQSIFKRINSL